MEAREVRLVGRYELHAQLGQGGMGVVHIGRLAAAGGFTRLVAIKRLHVQYATDPGFVSDFLDEARIAARVRHVNVVQTLDVIAEGDTVVLILELVPSLSLARLFELLFLGRLGRIPVPIVASLIGGVARGLHAAHVATHTDGTPLHLVHRDVSPQNILVGFDGVPKLIDFGIAKALGRARSTRTGEVKGKLAYMSPEQLNAEDVNCRTDVFAAGVVLWELLAGRQLFAQVDSASTVAAVLGCRVPPIPQQDADPDGEARAALEQVALKALARSPSERHATAEELADAIELAQRPATAAEVEAWLRGAAGETIDSTERILREIESGTSQPLPDGARAGPIVGPVGHGGASASTQGVEYANTVVDPSPRGARISAPEPSPLAVASPSHGRRAIAAAAALLLIVVAALWSLLHRREEPSVASASTGDHAPALERDEGGVSTPPPPPPDSASIVLPDAGAPLAQRPPKKPSTRPNRGVVGVRRADGGCRVEYTVDATGAKIFREECGP